MYRAVQGFSHNVQVIYSPKKAANGKVQTHDGSKCVCVVEWSTSFLCILTQLVHLMPYSQKNQIG